MTRLTEPPAEPAPTSTWSHVLDVIFFRLLGVALIAGEVVPRPPADWHVLVAGFGMFFMPDALRGRNSLPVQLARRWLERRV